MFNHNVKPKNGRHYKYRHLVYYEIESYYGSWILTAPEIKAAEYKNLLMSDDDINSIDESLIDRGYGYYTDEYLDRLKSCFN